MAGEFHILALFKYTTKEKRLNDLACHSTLNCFRAFRLKHSRQNFASTDYYSKVSIIWLAYLCCKTHIPTWG